MLRRLSAEDCLGAARAGEFAPALLGAAPRVALVLTQSWCPQWTWMRRYLEELPEDPERAVYYVEYDLEPFHEAFMAFKEEVLGNAEIPYVRYYRDGRLVRESNFIDRAGFLRLLDAAPKG